VPKSDISNSRMTAQVYKNHCQVPCDDVLVIHDKDAEPSARWRHDLTWASDLGKLVRPSAVAPTFLTPRV